MILSKILKVRTLGSVEEGNLRPVIVDDLPSALNLKALEYDIPNQTAIVEIWGSDHPVMVNKVDAGMLEEMKLHDSVIEEIDDHPNSGGYEIKVTSKRFFQESEIRTLGDSSELSYIRTEKERGEDLVVIEEDVRNE